MSLKSVKSKIRSIDKTRQVTKAMEAVSAVKMRKSQSQALNARAFALGAFSILKAIAGSSEFRSHSLMVNRTVKKTLLVVISADKGLAGSYGSSLIKFILKLLAKEGYTPENCEVITIGRKANEFFAKRNYTIHAHKEKWSDKIVFEEVAPIANLVRDLFESQSVDQVRIIYTNFLSTLRQEIYMRQLLPVDFTSVEDVIRGIAPSEGKFKELRVESDKLMDKNIEYVFEPNSEHIMKELVPQLFKIQIYHSVLEANASEHSSRMIAMKNASDNARDISKALKLRFNKVRQAAITKEVSEIVGGMESMKVID